MPRVSIILPTYNRVDLLPRAVDSILSQSFDDFELNIVDDGSTDTTANYLKTLRDERIIVITKENGGQPSALNMGLEAAKGDYVTFCDDDDEYLPNRLEICTNFFTKHSDVDACYTAFWVEEDTSKRYFHAYKQYAQDTFFQRYFMKSFLASIAVMVKRSAIGDVRFDETLAIGNDYDFFLRLAGSGVSFAAINEPTIIYYKHDAAMTKDYEKMYDVITLLKENYARFESKLSPQWRHKVWSSILLRKGKYYFWIHNIDKARQGFISALRSDWRNKRAWFFLPFTFLPYQCFDGAIWLYQKITGRYYSRDCA